MFALLGKNIKADLSAMVQTKQYETYSVNGKNIFDEKEEELRKMLLDLSDEKAIEELVLSLRGQ